MVLGSNCMWYGRSSPVRFGTIINTPAVTVVAYNCKVLFVLFYIVAVLLWSSIMKNKMGNKACNIKKVDKIKVCWRRQESNLRLVACEATTLPLSYTPFTSNFTDFLIYKDMFLFFIVDTLIELGTQQHSKSTSNENSSTRYNTKYYR